METTPRSQSHAVEAGLERLRRDLGDHSSEPEPPDESPDRFSDLEPIDYAAMEFEVEVICTATAGRLMKKGVAEKLFVKPGSPKSVLDFIDDAHEAGVKFFCCSPNLDLFEMTEADLIPQCSGIIGGAYLIERVMQDDYKVLTY